MQSGVGGFGVASSSQLGGRGFGGFGSAPPMSSGPSSSHMDDDADSQPSKRLKTSPKRDEGHDDGADEDAGGRDDGDGDSAGSDEDFDEDEGDTTTPGRFQLSGSKKSKGKGGSSCHQVGTLSTTHHSALSMCSSLVSSSCCCFSSRVSFPTVSIDVSRFCY